MRHIRIGNKGFSLTELMFAMTIMAVGLLALAQMQMMAMRGTVSANEFSKATKIAREGMERVKVPGSFQLKDDTVIDDRIRDHDDEHNDEIHMAPDIKADTLIEDLVYDVVEVFKESENDPMSLVTPICERQFPSSCAFSGDWDYVRITNTRNWPLGSPDHDAIMKEISITVLWKERGLTRSVNMRTLIGRKDNDFY